MAFLIATAALSGKAQQREPAIRLNAVGDVLLARGIERKIAAHGVDYPLGAIAPTLRHADLVIGNLECALSDRPFATRQEYRFRAAPERAKLLRAAGFTMMNLANNHTLDCGAAGYEDTKKALTDARITWCGEPLNGRTPAMAGANGVSLALLGYSDFPPARNDDQPPVIAYTSEAAIRADVSAARKLADIVVVNIHWGLEQHDRPTARQRYLARVAAQAGADLILGHHPHVLQGFEVLPSGRAGRRTLVAYSLGSFLYDGHKVAEKQSVILRCKLTHNGLESAEVVPVSIVHSQPRVATGNDASAILAAMRRLSSDLGASVIGRHIQTNTPRSIHRDRAGRGSRPAILKGQAPVPPG